MKKYLIRIESENNNVELYYTRSCCTASRKVG